MAENAGKCSREQAAALFFHQLARPLRAVLQMRHHISEELEVAGIVGHVRLLGGSLADVAQGRVGPFPKRSEHGAVHVFQHLPLADLVRIPLRDGLGIINPPLEKEQLGTGGGQLGLCRA